MSQTLASWSAAQGFPLPPLDTYPGRSPEGAKRPSDQEAQSWCVSVKLLSMETAFEPDPPGLWKRS